MQAAFLVRSLVTVISRRPNFAFSCTALGADELDADELSPGSTNLEKEWVENVIIVLIMAPPTEKIFYNKLYPHGLI